CGLGQPSWANSWQAKDSVISRHRRYWKVRAVDPRNGLDEAVHALYGAFATRSRRAEIEFDACDHCVSPKEAKALARTPLREISARLLSTFILNAIAETWGTADDLWYYLPRIMEFVANGGMTSYDILGLFGVMGRRWRDWPREQRDAVSRYMGA